jgi:hypothetical protein
MQTCSGDGSCRAEYSCVFPANINMEGEWQADVPLDERIARIIDLNQTSASAKICTALAGGRVPESEREGSEAPFFGPDGGVDDGL